MIDERALLKFEIEQRNKAQDKARSLLLQLEKAEAVIEFYARPSSYVAVKLYATGTIAQNVVRDDFTESKSGAITTKTAGRRARDYFVK